MTHRAGRTVGLRTVERCPVNGWITRIVRDAEDAEGRHLHAVGEPVSRIVLDRHTFIDINSRVRWDVDGATAWGEDQNMWPAHRWARLRRSARG